MSKLRLPNVTLIVIDCYNYGMAISSIKKSLSQIEFGAVKFLTDVELECEGVDVIQIKPLKSKNDYSQFLLKEAYKYIETDFVIVSQHDSWVLNSDCFDNRLYMYDYAGALWLETDGLANGNGGMSWRSFRLMKEIGQDDFINSFLPEDVAICRVYRNYLEINYGLKWATDEICEQFSYELREPVRKTFAFHSYFHPQFKEHIVVKRTAAMGDLIMATPVMDYYNEKGYQVVVDTLPEMMAIFFNHPYRLKHISEMNTNIKPLKVINLDMAYESNPKENVLKSYYKFAGISDGKFRNARLNVEQQPHQRLFNKFIVFHIDRTYNMPYRDVYGVNWRFVEGYYAKLGYSVIQVGNGASNEVGTFFNAETKQMLMYLLKGADAVCGIDSGICQLAVALGIPTAIFFGSVNPKLRYQNFDKIQVIKNDCPKPEFEYCYHNQESSITGTKCKIDEASPPCTANFSEWQVVKALNKLLKI